MFTKLQKKATVDIYPTVVRAARVDVQWSARRKVGPAADGGVHALQELFETQAECQVSAFTRCAVEEAVKAGLCL